MRLFNEEHIISVMTLEKRRRWEDNIKTCLKGIGFDAGDWIQLAECRVQ
jgi:hypothetical protein